MNAKPSGPQIDQKITDNKPSKWARINSNLNFTWDRVIRFFDLLRSNIGYFLSWTLKTLFWLLLITTILWWVLAVVVWPAIDAEYSRRTIALNNDSHGYLDVWSPSVVQEGTTPAEIRFTLQRAQKGEVITIKVTVPSEFIVIAPGNHKAKTVTLKYMGQFKQETKSIQLINANITGGLIIHQNKLNVKVYDIENKELTTFNVPIGAEGTWRYILRTFGGIDPDKFPLFPLATLLVSIGGFWLKQREEQRQQKLLEIEAARKLIEESFQFIRETLLREPLPKEDIVTARKRLDLIKQEDITTFNVINDWKKADQLIRFAQGDFTSDITLDYSESWLEETAGVLVYVVENSPYDRSRISAQLRAFPIDRINKQETRQQLEMAKSVLGSSEPAVRATWPSFSLVQSKFSTLPQKKDYKDPFPEDRAENEVSFLFREEKPLFWAGHPTLGKLLRNIRSTILIGEPGSGCTTLALALGKHATWVEKPAPFSCFIPGTASITEIRFALANRLLQFIEQNPHYLILMRKEQKSLLTQLLVFEIGKELVLSRLEAASPTRNQGWLKHAEHEDNKRKIWKAEAQIHLNMLIEAIEYNQIEPLPDNAWSLAINHATQLLKFNGITFLSIDADTNFSWEWFYKTIAPHQNLWNEYNLYPIIFTTPETSNFPKIKPSIATRVIPLKWGTEELGKMLELRWNTINKTPLIEVLKKEAKDELLVQAKGNPRRLIQLWQEIVIRRGSPIPVEKEAIRSIAKELF